jgi:hypothetical protein
MRKAIVQLPEAGFDALPDLPARLRMFLDVHGLPDRKRSAGAAVLQAGAGSRAALAPGHRGGSRSRTMTRAARLGTLQGRRHCR